MLAETREEVVRAESKASLLLASSGVVVAVLLAGVIAGDVSPWGHGVVVAVLSTISALLVLAGLFAVGYAVYPRVGSPQLGRARYYAEVAQFSSDAELRQVLEGEAEDLAGRDVQQARALSRLVSGKYRCIRVSMLLLCGGFLLAAVAGALSLVL